MSTVVPKLVMADKFLFDSLMDSAFPGANIQGIKEEELKAKIEEVAREQYYVCDDIWVTKLLQFHTIQNITHGVMLVGPSGLDLFFFFNYFFFIYNMKHMYIQYKIHIL